MNPAGIPDEIKGMKRWVNIMSDSKVPWMPTISRPASPNDPRTWGTFQDAVKAVNIGEYDDIGFVFGDDGIIGIDIDAGFNADGTISNMGKDIIDHCKSYTETSRSGRGFHILIRGAMSIKGRNNRQGVEIYRTGRYFITTGNRYGDEKLIRHNQKGIDYVLDTYFPDVRSEGDRDNPRRNKIYNPIWESPEGRRIPIRPRYPEIKQGSRNMSLLSLGGFLLQSGWDKDLILEEMILCNQTACNPPLDEEEVESVWASVCKYERR